VITAPFDGIAGAATLSVGDYVTSQSVITTVDDLTRLKVEMEVPERYLPNLKPGGVFTLRAATSAPGEDVTGEVYFVSPRIDENTRSTLVKGYVNQPPQFSNPACSPTSRWSCARWRMRWSSPKPPSSAPPAAPCSSCRKKRTAATVADFVPVKTGIRVPGYRPGHTGRPARQGRRQDRLLGRRRLILFPGVKLKAVDPVVTPGMPEATDRKLE
jgi:membrane fusion protein, multidrug efflux system